MPPLAERLFGTVGEVTRLFREMGGKEMICPVLEREPECRCPAWALSAVRLVAVLRMREVIRSASCWRVCHIRVIAYCCSTGYYSIGPLFLWDCFSGVNRRRLGSLCFLFC